MGEIERPEPTKVEPKNAISEDDIRTTILDKELPDIIEPLEISWKAILRSYGVKDDDEASVGFLHRAGLWLFCKVVLRPAIKRYHNKARYEMETKRSGWLSTVAKFIVTIGGFLGIETGAIPNEGGDGVLIMFILYAVISGTKDIFFSKAIDEKKPK